MRLKFLFLIWLIAFMVLCTPRVAANTTGQVTAEGQRVVSTLLEYYGSGAAASKLYIGSEACLACHPQYSGWRTSLHATGLKAPDANLSMQVKNGIIVDYDRNGIDDFKQGLDFNKISSVWDAYKPNAPILKYDSAKGYQIRIGSMDYTVVLVHGGSGSYKQRFLVKLPVTDRPGGWSAGTYYSPIQYNEANRQYVLYEPTYWYNADNTPKITGPITSAAAAQGKNFDKECAGCHSTAFGVSKDAKGEYVATAPGVVYADPADPHYFDLQGTNNKTAFNIGCERCHGPGSMHVTGLGDKTKVINPKNLEAKQVNQICGSCHSRGKSMPNQTFDYPYKETMGHNYVDHLGEDLYGGFFMDKPGLYPDGVTSRQHHQQFQDFMQSAKWEFAPHKVTCVECHDVHEATPKHIRTVMTVDGAAGATLKIATKVEDNSLCLACHAGFGPFQNLRREDIQDLEKNRAQIAAVVEAHTHHGYEPDRRMGLSRCTECHMAKVAASGAPYDISTHSFKVVPPEKTLATQKDGGMPNSCAVRCHRPLAPFYGLPADASLTAWTETSDVELARLLQLFYGPDGVWWNTQK